MGTYLNMQILDQDFDVQEKIPDPLDYRTILPDIVNTDSKPTAEKKFICLMKLWSKRGFSTEYDGRRDPVACQKIAKEEKKELQSGMPGGLYDESIIMRFSEYSKRVSKLQTDTEFYRNAGFLPKYFSNVTKPEDGYCEVINEVTVKYFTDHRRICFTDTTKEIHLYDNGTVLLLDIDSSSDAVFLVRDAFTAHNDKYLISLYEMSGEQPPDMDFSARLTDIQDNIGENGGELKLNYETIFYGEHTERTVVDLKLEVPKDDCELKKFAGIKLVTSEIGSNDMKGKVK